MRVHFICNGNAYRSRLAEAYFRSLNTGIETTSSGTRADLHRDYNDPRVVGYTHDFLERHGISVNLTPHPVQLTQELLRDDDVTVLINDIALKNAKDIVTLPKDVRVWDITDHDEQASKGEEVLDIDAHTERIFAQIKSDVDALVAELL